MESPGDGELIWGLSGGGALEEGRLGAVVKFSWSWMGLGLGFRVEFEFEV